MADFARYFSMAYNSAAVTTGVTLKSNFLSLRLIKESGVLNPKRQSYETNVLLNGKCIDAENRKLYVFYIDTFYNAAWIIEIGIDDRVQKVVYYDRVNNIGFDHKYKIYNARVVHGRIIWTDNKNSIYQIDIQRAKNSFYYGIGYGEFPTSEWSAFDIYMQYQIVSRGKNFYKAITQNQGIEPGTNNNVWEKLCLIEDAYYSMNIENFYFAPLPPKEPPIVEYKTDDSRKINNLKHTLFQVAYRYVYMDWRKSTFSPASIVPLPQSEEEAATGLANKLVSLNNTLQISVNTGGEEVRAIEVVARSSDDPSKWYLIETIEKFEEEERQGEYSNIITNKLLNISISVPAPTVININAPDAPLAIAHSGMIYTGFTANWNASENADGYYLDVSESPIFATFIAGYENKDMGNVLSAVISGLPSYDEYHSYYYRVRAYNVGGISINSNTVNAFTKATPPVAPVALSATSILGTSFQANWNASPSPLVIGYRIDVATDASFVNILPQYNNKIVGWVTNTSITGLTAGTKYYYHIRAFASDGAVSTDSNTISATTVSYPNPPVALEATEVTWHSFKMNWSPVGGVDGYRIYVSRNIEFTDLVINGTYVYGGSTSSYMVSSGILAGTTHYYLIRSYNGIRTSGNSNIIDVTTE